MILSQIYPVRTNIRYRLSVRGLCKYNTPSIHPAPAVRLSIIPVSFLDLRRPVFESFLRSLLSFASLAFRLYPFLLVFLFLLSSPIDPSPLRLSTHEPPAPPIYLPSLSIHPVHYHLCRWSFFWCSLSRKHVSQHTSHSTTSLINSSCANNKLSL